MLKIILLVCLSGGILTSPCVVRAENLLETALNSKDAGIRYDAMRKYIQQKDSDLKQLRSILSQSKFQDEVIEEFSSEHIAVKIIGHSRYTLAIPELVQHLMVTDLSNANSDEPRLEVYQFPFAMALSQMGIDAVKPLKLIIKDEPIESLRLQIACETMNLAVGFDTAQQLLSEELLRNFDKQRKETVLKHLRSTGE
jgi:hypothetical protein